MRTVKYYFSRNRFPVRKAKYCRYKSPSCCQKRTPRHISSASKTCADLFHTVKLLCIMKFNFHKFSRSNLLACVGTARASSDGARAQPSSCVRAHPLLHVTPLNFLIAVVRCDFPLFYLTSCCNKYTIRVIYFRCNNLWHHIYIYSYLNLAYALYC